MVLDSLKCAQEKQGDVAGLRTTNSLIERLYQEHDELDSQEPGDVSDDIENDRDDISSDEDNINLDQISDDSGLAILLVV